jgi:hypothetical protein
MHADVLLDEYGTSTPVSDYKDPSKSLAYLRIRNKREGIFGSWNLESELSRVIDGIGLFVAVGRRSRFSAITRISSDDAGWR